MKKHFFTVLLSLLVTAFSYGQTILSEGFEGGMVPPSGWIGSSVCAECPPESWFGWTADNSSHSGNYSAFVDYASPSHNSYLITPQLSITDNMLLTFWFADDYPGSASSTTLTVEISTSYPDPYFFTVLQTMTLPTTAYQFEFAWVDLSAYAGQNVYIAFHVEDEYGTGIYIDDVTVEPVPTCLQPINLMAAHSGLNDMLISWTPVTADPSSYTVQYVPSGSGWDNPVTLTTTDTVILLSGLSASSFYDVRVRTECDSNESSAWSDVISFNTTCESITVTEDSVWTETFESVPGSGRVPLDNCWETPVVSSFYSTPAVFCGLPAAAHSGVNSLELKGDYWEENMLVLPTFTNNLNQLRLSFFANTNATTIQQSGMVEVGYVTDPTDPTTFTVIEELTVKDESLNRTGSAPYGPFYFLEAPASGRMAVRFTSTAYGTSWNLDDITVGMVPDCLEPISLQASNLSSSSADLSWLTYGEHIYNIIVWPSGTTDTTYYDSIAVSELPFTVDSLQPLTSYSWIASTICDDSTLSTSIVRGHFTTPDVSIVLPYLQDFEGNVGDITEFAFTGTGTSQWCIGAATGVIDSDNPWATHSMYISDDQGLTNHYSGSGYSYAYATFPVQFPNTQMEYHLEFDFKLNGESGWDYFSVYLVDGGVTLPATGAPSGTQLLSGMTNTGGWMHSNLLLPDVVGTSKQIVFYWVNDSYIFNNPPVAVDNITINGNLCARPSALSVQSLQSNSVTLQWQENANATSWTVHYKVVGSSDTLTELEVSGTPSTTLVNLVANTDYMCYVTAFCEDTVQSQPSNPLMFRTSCSAEGIETLPYLETFTSTTSLGSDAFDVYVPCWSRLYSNATHRAYVNTQDFGSNCLDFHYTPGCYTMAVLPPLSTEIPANSVMLTFDARRHNLTTGALEVGVMTDPDDASTFQVIDTVELSATYVWENHTVYCNSYTGNGQYLAFRVNNVGSYTVAIDNLTVDYLPDCMPVSDIQVSNIATNGATVTWEGHADSYNVYLAGSSLNIFTTSTPSITLTDLLPSSAYTIMVQSVCGTETSVLSGPMVFETPCDIITVTADNPWEETFEHYSVTDWSVTPLSECWATPLVYSTNWGVYPGVVGGGEGVHSGVNSVEMYGPANMLVLPEFANPLNTLRVTFWASAGNTFAENTGSMQFGYVTDPTNPISFTAIATVPATALGYVGTDSPHADRFGPLDLQNVTAPAGARLAIRYVNTVTAYNSWHFDDFNVSLIPDCPSPVKNSVTCANVTVSTADISWVDEDTTHTQWEVHYRAEGEDSWQTTTSSVQTAALTDLTSNTTYQVYVITLCNGPAGVVDATNTIQFTTDMLAEELPYTTNFTTSDGWHFNNGSNPNYWTIGSPAPNSPNALYITHNGTTAGYDDTEESIVSVEKLFTVGVDPEFLVSFDVNVGGDFFESVAADFDYMKMFFAPASESYAEDFPSNPTWSAASYSTYAYDFSHYMAQSLGSSEPYKFNLTGGNTIHIDAIVPNPNPTPNAYSSAKLVFAWVNDYMDGVQPGAVITNLSVSPVTCQQPANLSVGNVGTSSANITWSGPSQTTWIFQYKHYYSSSWTTVPVASHYCQLSGLSPNTLYYVRVAADCGDGETSVWSELSFKTQICELSEQCTYTLYLTDSYGDGWNGAHLNVLQNNTVLGSYTIDNGYNSQAHISLCDSTPTTLSWSSGQYDSECTIYLYGPDGTQLYTNSDMDESGPIYTFTTDCSSSIPLCEEPIGLLAYDITDTTAYIDWMIVGNEQSYVLAYTTDTTGTWVYDTVPFNFYEFAGLTPGTTYYVKVRSNCGVTDSPWSEMEVFTTTGGEIPVIDPVVLTQIATDVTASSAVLNGAIAELGNQPILQRGFEWRKTSDTVYTTAALQSIDPILCETLENLTSTTDYSYRAFATTQYGTYYGQVRHFVTLEGITCEAPTHLDTVAVYNESLTVSWTDNAGASQWNVRYREEGGEWITVTVTATTYYITGLTGHTTYEIQVQAVCDDEDLSEWTPILTAVTKDVGIPSWLANSVTLYPNPTREYVDIRVDGDVTMTAMEVYNVYGQRINTVTVVDNPTRINVSGLAAGMYFVRVATEAGTVTKPFMKR